ncbi:glycosyltransferase family 8 protein [Sphingobacterium kitahiroshimense]|uniref:Glycosyltransferase n=1 Tax=Sphingobacterium kitahiroshimense TaxID=470446 RepID=A0ABV0BXF1_9SPHI
MKIVPIVFCFDDNLLLAAGVCLSSLLRHAKDDTFYDIYILHDRTCTFPEKGYFEQLHHVFPNFRLTYRNVGEEFDDAFEIRGITKATYYRLLIPTLIPEYDKIMYHDVDIIFRDDLSGIFFDTVMDDYYVAGVSTPYSDISAYVRAYIGVEINQYIAGGNLIINSAKMRADKLVDSFKEVARRNWKYQDMDVINVVCKGHIKYLPPSFCIVGTTSEILSDHTQKYYSPEDAAYALDYGIVHYNGAKPWNTWCYNFDIWWEYYRRSIYFDAKFYYDFYHQRQHDYDALSLWKRIKLVLRYFKTHS